MLLTGAQLRAARAMARLAQEMLADAAGISVETVRRLEKFDGPIPDAKLSTLRELTDAFAKHGVVFTAHGVEMRKREPAA